MSTWTPPPSLAELYASLSDLEERLSQRELFALLKDRSAAQLAAWQKTVESTNVESTDVESTEEEASGEPGGGTSFPEPPDLGDLTATLDPRAAAAGTAELELAKLYVSGQIDAWKQSLERTADEKAEALKVQNERIDADREHERELVVQISEAYIEVTKGSLDRVQKRAEFLAGGSALVLAAYTGVMVFVFPPSQTSPGVRAGAPLLGLIPGALLATSIVLSIAFSAYIKRNILAGALVPSNPGSGLQEYRLRQFMKWMFTGVLERAWMARWALVTLAAGALTLPLPFVLPLAVEAVGWTWALMIGILVLIVVSLVWDYLTSPSHIEGS